MTWERFGTRCSFQSFGPPTRVFGPGDMGKHPFGDMGDSGRRYHGSSKEGPAMPWKEASTMSLRQEFVALATVPGANMSGLCARFGVSRKTGYKWLARQRSGDAIALADRSRRP